MAKHRNKRTPKLRFSTLRNIGWHVAYPDPTSGIPTKHRFRIREKSREPEARVAYHCWLTGHLGVSLMTSRASLKPAQP